MSHDHDSYARINRERYTNFGIFDDVALPDILRLRSDTWYYDDLAQVGSMQLGVGGTTGRTGAGEFIIGQGAAFAQAFASIAHLRNNCFVGYKKSLSVVRGYTLNLEADDTESLFRTLQAQLVALPYVHGANLRLDARVAIRTDDGAIHEQWLRNVGALQLSANLQDNDAPELAQTGYATWTASLELGIISVFQRDNSSILTHVRESWLRLREQHPEVTWDDRDEPIAPLIVTLVQPPAGTPGDNSVLYERNAPGLLEAVAQWEHATGHPFVWSVSLA